MHCIIHIISFTASAMIYKKTWVKIEKCTHGWQLRAIKGIWLKKNDSMGVSKYFQVFSKYWEQKVTILGHLPFQTMAKYMTITVPHTFNIS